MTDSKSKVIIVGAGVFGLSTALHLKRRGYENVTIFDYQQYDQNLYDPSKGCDAASADVNKIYRCSYGDWKEYQDLAMKGRPVWLEWNKMIASTSADRLPEGLTPKDQLFVNGGFVRQNLFTEQSEYDRQSLREMEKVGLRQNIYIKSDRSEVSRLGQRAESEPNQHWLTKMHALDNAGGGKYYSDLDTFAGFTRADKACIWARHLCQQAGVKFLLGPEAGRMARLEKKGHRITGIVTVDGQVHAADVVVVACGGWTPGIVPQSRGVLEATAGSVITIRLPQHRRDLWDKYSPEKFPTWSHGMVEGLSPEYGGFYGFPRTPEGIIKIGYRGRKWTNYQDHPETGVRYSVPKTKYTADAAKNLPVPALETMKKAISELFPDLAEIGITDTRLCWYTDSSDDGFVIDYVPGHEDTLFVASGGSGHGFKFLPVLGEHIANQLEKKPDRFTQLWKWRKATPGQYANGLEDGEFGGRDLSSLTMALASDWQMSLEPAKL